MSANFGRVRFDESRLDGKEPLDEVLWRDGVVGSAQHFGESAGQTLINWVAIDGGYSDAQSEWRDTGVPKNTTEWHRVAPFDPIKLVVKETGHPFRWRVRIAGASSNGASVDFLLVVAPTPGELYGTAVEETAGRVKRWTGITSTVPAWLSPDDGLDYFDLDEHAIALELFGTDQDVSGGVGVDVKVWEVAIDVYGKTANVGSKPQIWGLHVSEFVGIDP